MTASLRPRSCFRWLLPALVGFLVLGHACELPAFAGLLDHHGEAAEAAAGDLSGGHDPGDEHELTCDGALALRGNSSNLIQPSAVVAAVAPVSVTVAGRPRVVLARPPITPAVGPPLFLLFSSLLI
jgi:hypothetical protein